MIDLVATVRGRLAEYLRAEFATSGDGVATLEEWPEPGAELPELAVTAVVAEGATPEVRFWQPAEFDLELGAGASGTVRYSHGGFELPLQLDVWARYPGARSGLVQRLGDLLFRHPSETLGGDALPGPRRWHELALRVDAVPGLVVFYRFEPFAPPAESGAAAQEGEYRATLRGRADGLLISQEAVAVLRNLTVELDVTDGSRPPGGDTETLTITG